MPFYILKISSLVCPTQFLKHCSNLSQRFSITRLVICSRIAAISSFILCFSSSIVVGLEMKRLFLRYPHKKQPQVERSGKCAEHGTSPPREMTSYLVAVMFLGLRVHLDLSACGYFLWVSQQVAFYGVSQQVAFMGCLNK
jgi:hypothetical protein